MDMRSVQHQASVEDAVALVFKNQEMAVFVVDPMIRFMPVIFAMILVRKKEKLTVMPKTLMLSTN